LEYIPDSDAPSNGRLSYKEKTVIKYCLPEEIRIKLEIFNSEKEKVKTLVDEIKEPGTYQVEFHPKCFKVGLYLYQLTVGSVILTKKMVLIN
jgi:hypothetical protein